MATRSNIVVQVHYWFYNNVRPPPTLMRFQESVFISTKTKRNIFIHTSVFVSFSKMLRFRLETVACDVFFIINVTVYKSLPFHLPTPETKRFQKCPLLKPFSKVSREFSGVLVWTIGEDKRKPISVDGALDARGAKRSNIFETTNIVQRC